MQAKTGLITSREFLTQRWNAPFYQRFSQKFELQERCISEHILNSNGISPRLYFLQKTVSSAGGICKISGMAQPKINNRKTIENCQITDLDILKLWTLWMFSYLCRVDTQKFSLQFLKTKLVLFESPYLCEKNEGSFIIKIGKVLPIKLSIFKPQKIHLFKESPPYQAQPRSDLWTARKMAGEF